MLSSIARRAPVAAFRRTAPRSINTSAAASAAGSLFNTSAPARLLVNQAAPAFTNKACMPDNTFSDISLSEFKGKKNVILFFYPADFTFVCASELPAFSNKLKDFEAEDTVVLGASTDTAFSHKGWKLLPAEHGGLAAFDINYPLLGDENKTLAKNYDVLLPNGLACRGVFLIDKNGVVQYEGKNNLALGRDVDECLAIVKKLNHTVAKAGKVIPANWKPGKDDMDPTTEGVHSYLKANK